MPLPPLPLALPDPINVELHAHNDCWPPDPEPWWRRLWPWREAFDPMPMWHSTGWAQREDQADPEDVGQWLAQVKMRVELEELEDRVGHEDEVEYQSPLLLQRSGEISADALTTLTTLVEQRREHAQSTLVLALPNKPDPYLFQAHPGYTLVHHATGIMASFYLEASGLGQVVAKSYSNPLIDTTWVPRAARGVMPKHFYGYGVGRRLYLTAHTLWPDIRWEDAALRSTSHALRSRLHEIDPYTWHDKTCPACSHAWRRATSVEEILALH